MSKPRKTSRMSPTEMWTRRIVSSTILLLLLGLLIFGIIKIIGAVTGSGGDAQNSQSGKQSGASQSGAEQSLDVALPSAPPAGEFGVRDCTIADLSIAFSPVTANPEIGTGTDTMMTVTNRSDSDCTFNTEKLQVELVTGDDTVWSPTACNSKWEKQLLFSPGLTWDRTFKWNGRVFDGCEPASGGQSGLGPFAQYGTYQLVASFDQSEIPSRSTIVIN